MLFLFIISDESIYYLFYTQTNKNKGGGGGIDNGSNGPTDTQWVKWAFHETKIKLLSSLILNTFSVSQRTLITTH